MLYLTGAAPPTSLGVGPMRRRSGEAASGGVWGGRSPPQKSGGVGGAKPPHKPRRDTHKHICVNWVGTRVGVIVS